MTDTQQATVLTPTIIERADTLLRLRKEFESITEIDEGAYERLEDASVWYAPSLASAVIELTAALDQERGKVERLREAAQAFTTKWPATMEAVDACIQISAVHGFPFPEQHQIGAEIDALRSALSDTAP
jgi:hypothetical protein